MASVSIIDVSPRDGLQNDARLIATKQKLKLVEQLVAAGVSKVEVTSFVRPDRVPQMADADEVLSAAVQIPKLEGIALVPNLKGYDRAKIYKPDEITWVSAASELFNQNNIGLSIEENLVQFNKVTTQAKADGISTCFAIAVSFGCPYEGDVPEERVVEIVGKAIEAGADRIGIADTIGIATPLQVERLMPKVLEIAQEIPVAIHLHDTRGLGLANAYSAYKAVIRIFETAVSGIGGCPFAPGAAGNLATEDLVYLFEQMDIDTGIHFEKILDVADYAASLSTNNPLGRIRHVEKREGIIK